MNNQVALSLEAINKVLCPKCQKELAALVGKAVLEAKEGKKK